jgi:hypothetical protein
MIFIIFGSLKFNFEYPDTNVIRILNAQIQIRCARTNWCETPFHKFFDATCGFYHVVETNFANQGTQYHQLTSDEVQLGDPGEAFNFSQCRNKVTVAEGVVVWHAMFQLCRAIHPWTWACLVEWGASARPMSQVEVGRARPICCTGFDGQICTPYMSLGRVTTLIFLLPVPSLRTHHRPSHCCGAAELSAAMPPPNPSPWIRATAKSSPRIRAAWRHRALRPRCAGQANCACADPAMGNSLPSSCYPASTPVSPPYRGFLPPHLVVARAFPPPSVVEPQSGSGRTGCGTGVGADTDGTTSRRHGNNEKTGVAGYLLHLLLLFVHGDWGWCELQLRACTARNDLSRRFLACRLTGLFCTASA